MVGGELVLSYSMQMAGLQNNVFYHDGIARVGRPGIIPDA
jgi:hypothetical protein